MAGGDKILSRILLDEHHWVPIGVHHLPPRLEELCEVFDIFLNDLFGVHTPCKVGHDDSLPLNDMVRVE